MKTVKIKTIFFHVTKACNLRCKYCYFSANKPLANELRTEEFPPIWKDIVSLRPEKVVFTGGEPLLRDDILELLDSLREADKEHHILRCINSNGSFVTAQLAQELVGLADEVRISLDALQEKNDYLRGKGNFASALRSAALYKSVGFDPKILITVTSYTVPDLEDLVTFLLRNGFSNLNLNFFRPIGRGQDQTRWIADIDTAWEAVERGWLRVYSNTKKPNLPTKNAHKKAYMNCGVGSYLNIMSNGDIYPCHVLTDERFKLGNLRKNSLLKICKQAGVVNEWQNLNFPEIEKLNKKLIGLSKPKCLGEVHEKNKSLEIWGKVFPTSNT